MSRLLVVALLVVGCSAPATETTSTTVAPTAPPTPPSTTTTTSTIEVTIQDCGSPPVTFSSLCEIYELLETWYVDTPVDAVELAALAVTGLEGYETTETEEAPRTLFCAIPDPAFSPLCDALAARVTQARLPVGPAIEAATSYMVDTGLDPFTYYLPPGQTGAVRLNGVVGGIGAVIDARDAAGSKCAKISEVCQLEIVILLDENPGKAAGLETGDIISAVDGEPVVGRGFTAVVSQIAGDETGVVDITVLRDGTEMSFSVERTELVIPTVEFAVPSGDIGYIKIPDFELDIPDLVAHGLSEMASSRPSTLVVDLRDNPGGYVDSVIRVADEFIDGGVVMMSDAPNDHEEYSASAGGSATEPRLLVLVNQGTASAAEILAGALRDRRGAVIVGTNTFGKDAVQIPFTLRNGGEFHVAVARWSTPNGETVGGGGLTPDREVDWPAGSTVPEIVEIALEAAS